MLPYHGVMKLLAIDTTESACSAALLIDDQCQEQFEIAPRRHSELLLPMVEQLLAEANVSLRQLDAVAFARGPGSFTGVRIACAAAQGLATAADLPVVAVSSLLALAQGAMRSEGAAQVLAGFDARMNEVYWLACQRQQGLAVAVEAEQVCAPQAIPEVTASGWVGCGSAWSAYADVLQEQCGEAVAQVLPQAQVHAQDVARLALADYAAGKAVAAGMALPVYLRDQVARKMRER